MTAEVVILNKSAVAMAADSTVTIDNGDGKEKTYNTVNKLFTLSKYAPIGAMIFGNANFMGVPWETIVKEYRRHLGQQAFDTIDDYRSDIAKFIEGNRDMFPESQQEFHVWLAAYRIFLGIKSDIDRAVEEKAKGAGTVSDADIRDIADSEISDWLTLSEKKKPLPYLGDGFAGDLIKKYEEKFREARDYAFEKHNLSDGAIQKLSRIAALDIAAADLRDESGLVVAGFGGRQIFPAVATMSPFLIALDRLVYRNVEGQSYTVSFENEAVLIPFAQREVVRTFLNGIDPSYRALIEDTISSLFESYPSVAADAFPAKTPEERGIIIEKIKADTAKLKDDFIASMEKYKNDVHVAPLIDVIAVMPKDELAAMAEALVNLTAVKRKMSLETETVGGPVDVAVISKGDGFVWISRKHYFKPELNPLFVSTYFQR